MGLFHFFSQDLIKSAVPPVWRIDDQSQVYTRRYVFTVPVIIRCESLKLKFEIKRQQLKKVNKRETTKMQSILHDFLKVPSGFSRWVKDGTHRSISI